MQISKLYIFITIFSFIGIQAQEYKFPEAALNDSLINEVGEKVSFNSKIEVNRGKVVLLDIWASWCKDCVIGMPIVKDLKKEYPEVSFVYISLDRNEEAWKKGIQRFKINDGTHYWAAGGWDSALFKGIDLDWIPRYIVLDEHGNIKLYKAIKANDKRIVKQLRG